MITRTVLTLLLGAVLIPAADRPDRPEKLAFKPLTFTAPRAAAFKARLKNGIPVFIHADPEGAPLVRLNVAFRGGTYMDPKGKEGLASLMGSQWRAGGSERTNAEALNERLEFLAAAISSGCGDTSGSLGLEVMGKDLQEGLDLFMQVLTRPAFAQDRLDRAKKSRLQGISSRNDSINSIAGYQMPFLLNGEGHFSSSQPTAASLEGITREDMKDLHRRLLHPANLVVSVSGKFERKVMLNLLDRSLGALVPDRLAQVSPKVPAPAFDRQPGIYLVDKDVPQSLINFALPGLRRTDPDWHSAMVMNQILGGGDFTSRLMKKIRSDEGLTYGIGSAFGQGTFWRGNWSCGFQTKNRSVAYALRLAFEEIERIKSERVSEAELASTQESLIEAYPGQWANRKAVVGTLAAEQLAGWPEDWHVDFREKIRAVSREDVQRVARRFLKQDQLVVLVVGKASEVEAGDKDHPGKLKEISTLPLRTLPLRGPQTMTPMNGPAVQPVVIP